MAPVPIYLRKKIDSLIKREPVLDQDCPDDPESCRWWCYTGANAKETDRLRVEGKTVCNVRASGEGISSMLEGVGSVVAGGAGSAPSMQSIMQVMNEGNASVSASGGGRAKAKAKNKGNPNKAKAVVPQTVKEKRVALRDLTRLVREVRFPWRAI